MLVNLCPHEVVIVAASVGDVVDSIPEDQVLARLESKGSVRLRRSTEPAGTVTVGGASVPLDELTTDDPDGLPGPEPGVTYVVSVGMLSALSDRSDLVSPGRHVVDSSGRVVACRSLVRMVRPNLGEHQ